MNLRTRTASRTGSLLLLVWLAAAPACRQDPAVVAAAFVASGDRYFTGRQYKAATLEYRNALEHQPQAAAIHRKLARAYDAAGQPRKALASLATVTGLVDNDSEANLRVSQALVATRRYKDARQLATRVQPGDPLYGDARIVVATAAASLGEAKAADGALAEALAIDPHSRAAHLLKASWQLRDRQVAAARRTLETLLRFHPDAADGWRALGALDWQAGATAAAEPSLRRALELSPDDAEIRRLFASYVIAVGRAPEAEVHLRAVAEKSSPDRLRLAAYYAALNRLDEAEREVTAIIEGRRADGAARLLRAKVRYLQGRQVEAEQDLAAAMRDHEVEPDARLLKSSVHLQAGNGEAALQEARSVAERFPKRGDASHAAALAALQQHDWDQAMTWLERARYTTRAPAWIDLQLAQVALAAGRAHDAVRYARRAATDLPAPETHAVLARALRATGNMQAASATIASSRRRWRQAVALDLEAGYLAMQRNQHKAALAAFERAARGAPNSPGVVTILGMARQEGGDQEGARAAYERALGRNPRDGIAANNLAWLYAESGRLDEALSLGQRAVDVLAGASQALDTLGWVHYLAGRHEDAIHAFQSAVEKQSDNPTYLQHLGMAYLRAGRHLEARGALERALRTAPSLRDAAAVRKVLADVP